MKIGQFLAEKRSFSAYFANFRLNGRFLKIYKNECLEPLGGPNELKIKMDSLWDILKKIIYQIFDILIFRDFWTLKNAKSAKNAKKRRFSDLTGPKNREKSKYQKFDR